MEKGEILEHIERIIEMLKQAKDLVDLLLKTDIGKSTTQRIAVGFIDGSLDFAIINLEKLVEEYRK